MTESLLDQVRIGAQLRNDARARNIAINGRSFVLDKAAAGYLRKLADDDRLLDELREFAIPPFDTFSVSSIFSPALGGDDIEVLHLWANGKYRTVIRQYGGTGIVPGWTWHDGERVRNEAVEARPDADDIWEKLRVDHNVLTAFCLILAQPSTHIVHMGQDRPSRMKGGRLVKFMASSEIVIRLDKPAQLRRLFHTGTHASPRRHEVRRHWWHFGGAREHTHTWERVSEEGQPLKFVCSCGRIRRERGPFERGDAGRGFVMQKYKVEADAAC